MAIAATINLGLVLFNLSYVPGRDFYLRNFPELTRVYDPIKGIEPHRETQNYLNTVNALEEQVSQTGLQSPQAEALLAELRSLSSEMIDTNPFEIANKTGTLEKIKNRMRDRLNRESSREAFNIFWSQAHLSEVGWQQEIGFFNQRIRPLIATNYYRNTGENGEFIDRFWRIDIWFIALFSIEFLARTFYISRRHTGVRWIDAMLWRWYDVFLLIPFGLPPFTLIPLGYWLRTIPVIIRLNQAELINLEQVRQQISQGIVANFAGELTQVVVVQVIDQIQAAIERGELSNWLTQGSTCRPYIDINNTNEVEAIAGMLVQMTVYQVLPEVQPDVVAILRHNIESVIKQSPGYQVIQNLPGLGDLSTNLSEHLATQVTQSAYDALVAAVEDPIGAKLSSQLVEHFSVALGSQVQKKQTLTEIRSLLSDLLEEVKLNYVKQLEQEDVEQVLEQTRHLRQQALVDQALEKGSILPKPTEKK